MSEQSSFDASSKSPEELALMVQQASDQEIEQELSDNWDQVLQGVFGAMQEHFEPDRAEGVNAVCEWRIKGKPDGDMERWQVVIRDKACAVSREGSEAPSIALELSALDFVKMAAQKLMAPELFMGGRLKVEGDMMLAARLQGLFRVPELPDQEPSAAEGPAAGGDGPPAAA